MVDQKKTGAYHLLTAVVVVFWGTTFVSTKLLLEVGLSPADIMFYRFLLAYIVLWLWKPSINLPKNRKDELLFVAGGVCGGSLYFLTENIALQDTLTSNVALLVSTAPLFTLFLTRLWFKTPPMNGYLIGGSLIALTGVALVVFNGKFSLQINPLGYLLSISAAICWAFYSILIKLLDQTYSTLYITRKIFFYGLVTLLPAFCLHPLTTDPAMLLQPVVLGNLLFLGLVASFFCYLAWNRAVERLGTIATSNYIYIVPLVTLLSSAVVLSEPVTPIALLGALLIIGGVYLAQRGASLTLLRKRLTRAVAFKHNTKPLHKSKLE